MKKVVVELILPDHISLQDIAGMIAQGGCHMAFPESGFHQHDGALINLTPEVVATWPRDDHKITLLLTPTRYYNPSPRHYPTEGES